MIAWFLWLLAPAVVVTLVLCALLRPDYSAGGGGGA
jgi:hypothetical protein